MADLHVHHGHGFGQKMAVTAERYGHDGHSFGQKIVAPEPS
jgi:hypothetical protein